ncbi:MAG: hypothetical protein ACLPTM_16735, partial [Steroidobacteraceae bacterium]
RPRLRYEAVLSARRAGAMKISDDGMPQPSAKSAFGFAHLLSAQAFAQRGPLEIGLAGDKLGTTALIERCAA